MFSCIEHGAVSCLYEVCTRFQRGVREALRGDPTTCSIDVLIPTSSQPVKLKLDFDNEVFALLARRPNTTILTFLLNQDGFIPSHTDFRSLILAYCMVPTSVPQEER